MTAPLDKLHDFYQPPPPSWRPQTIGWYVVFAIVVVLLLWLAVHLVRQWIANRYRREALRELTSLEPQQFSALLKRTALAAWPRRQVASLSGDAWLGFLNRTAHGGLFEHAPESEVEAIALRPAALSSEDEHALRESVATWIRRHRRDSVQA